MPPTLGSHRPGAVAPARAPGPAPERASAAQTVQRYDQGDLLARTTPAFQRRWGLGVCRSLVAQWLRSGGELAATPFYRAQALQARLLTAGNVRAAAGVALDLQQMLDGQMSDEREDMLAVNGLEVVATMPLTRLRSDILAFFTSGGRFYLKLASADLAYGHAVGVVVEPGGFKLFDPNTRNVEADLQTMLRHLWHILDHWENTPPFLVRYEAQKVVGGA